MSDRSDHLIERAAALLRAGGNPAPAEPVTPPPAQPSPSPTSRAPGLPRPGGAIPVFTPPTFTPPPRNAPNMAAPRTPPVAPQPNTLPQQPRSALVRGGSVADLRTLSTNDWIELGTLERAGLMVARGSRTRTTEEYRIVIGRVLRALHEEPEGDILPSNNEGAMNVVMVTSARPGEGKSFTALNLGGSIAQNAGESVLLVDVDAKHNSMTDLLGLNDRPGFLDLVANPDLQADEFIVPTELPNFSFLPLGSRSTERDDDDETPPDERRLTPPIRRLAQRFPKSLILLDAPPCLSTSDPHTLAPAVGQVVMVVEAERTQRNEVESALDLIRVCPIVTMLLNKVRMKTGHTFGSYDYFGSYT